MPRTKTMVVKDKVEKELSGEQVIFTAAETAAALGISERSLTNWRNASRITPTRVGSRWFYTREQILNAQ